jgi:hypothetical protein
MVIASNAGMSVQNITLLMHFIVNPRLNIQRDH